MAIPAIKDVATELNLLLDDGATGKFPQGTVYDSGGTPLSTLDLSHVAQGLYTSSFTFTSTGDFIVVYVTFTNAGHTIESKRYGRATDRFRVSPSTTVVESTAQVGSTSTEIRTSLTQADNFFNGMFVQVVNSAGTVVRRIEQYSNTNGAITVDEALPFTPASGDTVVILTIHDSKDGGVG